MIITNKFNLPTAFVNLAQDEHGFKEKEYSVTTLLQPIREIMLKRRFYNEIEEDVADRIWAIFGSAVHKVMEEADKTGFAELHLKEKIKDDYYLTGICDLYNEEAMTVEDYKTCSVFKILNADFDDWKKQGLMYAWLLRKQGKYTSKLRFHALMKDWSSRDYRFRGEKWYPEHPIWTWEYEITESDMQMIESFIYDKFDEIIKYESADELPLCSMEERWNPGDKYALKKPGAKRAIKVCDTLAEAQAQAAGLEIETRKGEDKKCIDYCRCCKFCDYWRKNYEN